MVKILIRSRPDIPKNMSSRGPPGPWQKKTWGWEKKVLLCRLSELQLWGWGGNWLSPLLKRKGWLRLQVVSCLAESIPCKVEQCSIPPALHPKCTWADKETPVGMNERKVKPCATAHFWSGNQPHWWHTPQQVPQQTFWHVEWEICCQRNEQRLSQCRLRKNISKTKRASSSGGREAKT